MGIGSTQPAEFRLAWVMALALALSSCGGGGSSAPAPTSNPVPRLYSIFPSSTTAGGGVFTLTTNGTNFIPGSEIRWGGAVRTTTFVSSTTLTTRIAATDIATVGDVAVTVFNPSPGGGASSALTFNVLSENPVPGISSISPSDTLVGTTDLTLNVAGTNFVYQSVIYLDGLYTPTHFISSTQLSTLLPTGDLEKGKVVNVSVFNPAPGGGESNVVTFTINYPVPALTSISPESAISGSAGVGIQAFGRGITLATQIHWNGSPRHSASDLAGRKVLAEILASDVAEAGTATITLVNPSPGGGTSNPLTFTILPSEPLVMLTSRLPATRPAARYHFELAADGGVPPYWWALTSGSLPGGLLLDSFNAFVSGTAGTAGTFDFTLTASDSSATPRTASRDFSIVVSETLGRNDDCSGGPANVTQISNGVIRASFSPYGDVDVYTFEGTAGKQVKIEALAHRIVNNYTVVDSFADTMLELLDDTCPAATLNGTSALAFNDDIVTYEVQDSRIEFTLPYTGTYFIRVRDFRGDGRPDLLYDLSLSGAD
jgi:hypothetical protein